MLCALTISTLKKKTIIMANYKAVLLTTEYNHYDILNINILRRNQNKHRIPIFTSGGRGIVCLMPQKEIIKFYNV